MSGVESRQLAHFLAVVDHGSVTRAAHALYISQPSLSQAIRGLEKQVGVRLFRRTASGIVLTTEGQALVEPARQILRDVDDARDALRGVAGLRSGRLVVAADAMLALDPLMDIVERWHRAHPDIVIDIRSPHVGAGVVDLVRVGTCELGLVGGAEPPGFLAPTSLGLQELHLVLPPGTQAPPTVRLADLAGADPQPLVLPPIGSSDREVVEAAFEQAGVRPTVVVECGHLEALGTLVLEGTGATFFPPSLAESWARSGAVVRRTRPAPVRELAVVARKGRLSPAASTFLTHAAELHT